MGSLESNSPVKRDLHSQRPSLFGNTSGSGNVTGNWGQRCRSRLTRLVLFKKIDYLHFLCAVAVFFFFIFLFQIFFLPGSTTDAERKSDRIRDLFGKNGERGITDMAFLNDLDFGEDLKFEPSRILAKFQKDAKYINESIASRRVIRFGYKKPKLAMVFADLWVDPHQILMVTVATALREIGYEIEVFSLEDGPVRAIWTELGLPLSVITADENMKFSIDWLNYHGILVNSLKAVGVLSSLMQEPFRSVPLVWTIHEQTLAVRLREYISSGETELVENWRKVFHRPTVIVFPSYILPLAYSKCDPGNYFVIPGSPAEAWEAEMLMASNRYSLRAKINYVPDVFSIAIVGSRLLYRGLWLEHALVLQALYPVLKEFSLSSSLLKIFILAGESKSNYSRVVETIALNLKYPNESVKHVAVDEDADAVLSTADLVIYGSLSEEHTFPDMLLRAMCFGKPIVAPDLPMIGKYVSDRVNGFLFPKKDIGFLTEIVFQLFSNGKLSLLARNAASIAKRTAKNMMASETVEGYASLLEKILMLPSEVAVSHAAIEIPTEIKSEWHWRPFGAIKEALSPNKSARILKTLNKIEEQFVHTQNNDTQKHVMWDDALLYEIWEDQKNTDLGTMRKRREDEEVKDRTHQPRSTWDDVYRNARRVDRTLHERDEGELLRTGQPLTIYEPYFGEGTWPFLHRRSLYRGIGLSTKGRRPVADDIDGPARLPLLHNAYYRDLLEEFGAYFAIANRVDRIHKNAWIGFQTWRATARMISLTQKSEMSLLDAIEARRHGNALYFWSRLDLDPRYGSKQDFWSFCDAVNAGNCQLAFSKALKKMYGVKHNLTSPYMPSGEGTWSVMHCWALPTRSFLEFVMFSRMFVDALDAQLYDEHHKTGHCYLSPSKDKHCYSRLLELLVNVWAYNSARRMVYVDPETGSMQEQHELNSRRGQMWIKWFQFSTLKSMDEDLAEEFDSERPKYHWLWPSTGEVFWQGIYVKEKSMRIKEKERKKQQSRDKIQRIRRRSRQKALGRYIKPVEEELEEESNSTTALQARLL